MMFLRFHITLSIFLIPLLGTVIKTVNAQDYMAKVAKDAAAIKEMCGCYEVTFNFAETFEYSDDSTYVASPIKRSGGLEWVEFIEEADDSIILQHLLIVGAKDNPMIVKHWRQDWIYQNTEFYRFHADRLWKYDSLPFKKVEGQWTQKVYQVDDSPRYEASGSWVHVDGKSFWESIADAPLPRREFSIRNDYNVLSRLNRHEITSSGWIHEQDNQKILRKNGQEDVIIAEEKGMNIYTKVDDSICQAAQNWWAENNVQWAKVRTVWQEIFDRNNNLVLKAKVEDKLLFQHLFELDSTATELQIRQIIDSFVITPSLESR